MTDWTETGGWPLRSPAWRDALRGETEAPYMLALRERLRREALRGARPTPALDNVMLPLELTDPARLRVIILAQDPYPRAGRATGLAFALPAGDPGADSFANMLEELSPGPAPAANLLGWAAQGVLLVNTVWTTETGLRLKHDKWGWQRFTTAVLGRARDLSPPMAVLLWGKPARGFAGVFDGSPHRVIETSHPSRQSRGLGFRGSRPFDQANAFLVSVRRAPIDWSGNNVVAPDEATVAT